MAWTSMHFAAGMIGGGVLGVVGCAITRRGWRWLPLAMTAGGIWALIPDSPRLFREDFPRLGLAQSLGSKDLERWIHSFGDLFFLHARLDAQPREYALHGLALILLLYNASIVISLIADARRRRRERREIQRRHEAHMEAARFRQASPAQGASPPDALGRPI